MKYLLGFFALTMFLVSCTKVTEVDPSATSAISGKYNTMKVVGDYIYAVTDSDLVTIDRSDSENLEEIDRIEIGGQIENLYLGEKALFIGSDSHLHIFELKDNGLPQSKSSTEHLDWRDEAVQVCDPVAVKEDIAYVTLSSDSPDTDSPCSADRILNMLKIYDVHEIESPKLLLNYQMNTPQGLSIDGDLLFITNLQTGTDVFRLDHQGGIELEAHIEGGAHDVIAIDGKVMIVSKTEINQYDYSNVQDIVHFGTIAL